MGRHSAPDDDFESPAAAPAPSWMDATAEISFRPGRHSTAETAEPQTVDSQQTDVLPLITPTPPKAPPPPASRPPIVNLPDVAASRPATAPVRPPVRPPSPPKQPPVAAPAAARPAAAQPAAAQPAAAQPAAAQPAAAQPAAAQPAAKAASEPPPGRTSATHADLRLLRDNPALRARCAAAIIVPFVLFVVVLAAIGHMDAFLLWVWIPAVTAGVLVGSFLDSAHKRRARPT